VDDRCRICSEPATASIGAYRFCERHRKRALTQRSSLWRADLLSLLLLVAFVAGVAVLDAALDPDLSDAALVTLGAAIALVPAAIWLAFFWRRDRLEPEPAGMVLGVFALGWLVAGAVAAPLLEPFFDIAGHLDGAGPLPELAGRILVTGVIQVTLLYLVVRLSVYRSAEFDEWTDGILYGTAAGLGYATWLTMGFVVDSGGAEPVAAALRATLTALVLGSLGGLMGWFLGHDRLEVRPTWWMPAGILLAAVLDGLYWMLRATFTGGFAALTTTWAGLALAVLLAVGVTVFLARSVQRDLGRVLATTTGGPPSPPGGPPSPAEGSGPATPTAPEGGAA
jgi:protease PrsW